MFLTITLQIIITVYMILFIVLTEHYSSRTILVFRMLLKLPSLTSEPVTNPKKVLASRKQHLQHLH